MRFEFDDQAAQERHRIDLGLIAQSHPAVEGEGNVGGVDPFGVVETRVAACSSTDLALLIPLGLCA